MFEVGSGRKAFEKKKWTDAKPDTR